MSESSEGGPAMPDDLPANDLPADHTVPPVGPADLTDPFGQSAVPAPDEALLAMLAERGAAEGDDAWPARAHRSGVHLGVPMVVLLALVIAAGAFWGGAAVQRADGTTSSGARSSAFASRIAALLGRAGASSGGAAGGGLGAAAGGLGGFTAPAATGTLTAVVGRTLYLTSSSGTIVKVDLPPTATIDRTAAASAAELKSGDRVVVEGTTSRSGVVTATSVSASAPGVASSARRAFAGLGGGAGGFGGTGTGGSGG